MIPLATSSSQTLELNCLVLGDDFTQVFTVEILESKNVSALKKAIKDEKKPFFDHVPADSLILWRVSIPVDSEFQDKISELILDDTNSLSAVDRLSKLFSDVPQDGHLHIVVRAPSVGAC